MTGAAGFLGSHFVRTLVAGGYPALADAEVVILDKLTYAGNLANLPGALDEPRLRFVRGDVADPTDVEGAVDGVDSIVHFAAETHVDRSIEGGGEFVRANVDGTHTLLDAARRAGVARFVHVSTDEVYGSITEGSFTEDDPLRPSSPYSASKAGADLIVQAYHRTHDAPVTLARLCNAYGPHQHPEKVIPRFVTNLLDGRPVPLYGDGRNVRTWMHVDDSCRAVQLVLERGRAGEIYNVGGGPELTNLELTERLLAACGAGWDRVRFVADRKGHDRRYSLDWTKIRTELGFTPRFDFETGLAETVRWYAENRAWWEPLARPVPTQL
ncbi:MAG: dTDP-glucose 4,6-dehydratase [Actinomycetota bacterium]|nr:dTDP-glucose 4,6-dehydratase [Actinomycetota bacterium]